jgi:DNA polymerase III subunit beta
VNFTVPAPELAGAAAWVGRTISTRPTLPVLGGILMELTDGSLRLAGTDLEHTGEVTIEVAGDGTDRVVVPGRIFGDVLRNLPDGLVQVLTAEGSLKVDCGQVSHELRLLDVADFPTLAEPALAQAVTLAGDTFAAAAAQVGRAAAHDDARPVLSGVLVEMTPGQLTLAACDSYRLAVRELPCTWAHDPTTALVPARSLAEVARSLSGEDTVTVALEAHQATIVGGSRRLTTRLIEGEFPKFRALIPSGYQSTATVERQGLLDALKQVAPYGESNNPVRLTFDRDRLQVDGSLQDVGKGHTEVPAKYDGDAVTVAFNPAYLADGIAGVATTEVVLEVQDGLKPALVHAAEQDGYLYLLMPVRVP